MKVKDLARTCLTWCDPGLQSGPIWSNIVWPWVTSILTWRQDVRNSESIKVTSQRSADWTRRRHVVSRDTQEFYPFDRFILISFYFFLFGFIVWSANSHVMTCSHFYFFISLFYFIYLFIYQICVESVSFSALCQGDDYRE